MRLDEEFISIEEVSEEYVEDQSLELAKRYQNVDVNKK